jgi:hypothetical protein
VLKSEFGCSRYADGRYPANVYAFVAGGGLKAGADSSPV